MEISNKYRRQISPQDKLNALKSVWSKAKTVAQICRQMDISRETYHQWAKKALAQMAQGLMPAKPGRHPKDYIAPPEMTKEIKRLKRANQRLQKQSRQLQRSNELKDSDLKIAKIIFEDILTVSGVKKNGATWQKPS